MKIFEKITQKTFSINYNAVLFILTLSVYVYWTIANIHLRIPFFDEINAWNIAGNCTFRELFEVSKHEGHFILWYMILKPFAINNVGFPYIMFLINWIFAFLSVLVLWFKSPFNSVIKMLITFSLPIQMFSIYARCYSIGVLILFIICSIYKERIKHPIIYSLLIIFLANTSIVAAIPAFVLGILYIWELLTTSKNLNINKTKIILKTLSIFLFGVIIALVQVGNYTIPWYSTDKSFLLFKFKELFTIAEYQPHNIVIISQAILILFGFLFFTKDKIPYLFLISTSGILTFIALRIYVIAPWHFMFFFIFLVCAIWMYMQNNNLTKTIQKIYYIIFGILCFFSIFFFKPNWQWNGFHIPTTNYILEHKDYYENSRIFMFPPDSSVIGIIPMLKDYNISFYDSKGNSYKFAQAYIDLWNPKRIDFDGIKKEVLNNSDKFCDKNYIFIPIVEQWKDNKNIFILEEKENKNGLKFIPFEQTTDVIIYKIILN